MTTARTVPVTTELDGDELDAADAWKMVRKVGVVRLLLDSFIRFRYGDGFTNSRALALQAALAVVPFLLALTGLAADIEQKGPSSVLVSMIQAVSPGSGGQDALASAMSGKDSSQDAGELALALGLGFSVLSMTTAMAQVERGLNRIYGVRRDRPAIFKYGRSAVLTVLLAVPLGLCFLLLVTGGAFADAMVSSYGWSDSTALRWNLARWPAGLLLAVTAIAVLLNHSPRRRQPSLSWLALGAAIGIALSMLATAMLALYVRASDSFGTVYGPLGGMFALLLWALASSIAFFYGAAVCAQLEACRAGVGTPVYDDPGRPHKKQVAG